MAFSDQVTQRATVIGAQEIAHRLQTAVSDVLREEPGVEVQRTVPAMGGASVGGLLGKNVAVYRDGVRFTTSAQRSGVSTFLYLMEASALGGVEVLRGPNSAQYGSASLGGTLHFPSRPAPLGSNGWHVDVSPSYSSGLPSTVLGTRLADAAFMQHGDMARLQFVLAPRQQVVATRRRP